MLKSSELPQEVASLYCKLLDHQRGDLPQHLTETARLDWFGRIITGRAAIAEFLNSELTFTQHSIESVVPIGPVDDHVMPEEPCAMRVEETLPERPVTPDNKIPRPWDTSHGEKELEQLALVDSEYHTQVTKMCHAPRKPKVRRFYLDHKVYKRVPTTGSCNVIQYVEAVGSLLYVCKNVSPSSAKMLKTVTEKSMMKERNCKMQLAYAFSESGVQISLIVYHDNMPCRRKLVFPKKRE